MKYKKGKKVWRRAINDLLRDCVTRDSLRAEVAAPNVNDSHVCWKIKTHRERCYTCKETNLALFKRIVTLRGIQRTKRKEQVRCKFLIRKTRNRIK